MRILDPNYRRLGFIVAAVALCASAAVGWSLWRRSLERAFRTKPSFAKQPQNGTPPQSPDTVLSCKFSSSKRHKVTTTTLQRRHVCSKGPMIEIGPSQNWQRFVLKMETFWAPRI